MTTHGVEENANHKSDKGLISRIHKELQQQNAKQTNSKVDEALEGHFSKEYIKNQEAHEKMFNIHY